MFAAYYRMLFRLSIICFCFFSIFNNERTERRPYRFPVATKAEKNDSTNPPAPPLLQETKLENNQDTPKYEPNWVLYDDFVKSELLRRGFHESLLKPPNDLFFSQKIDSAGVRFFIHKRVLWYHSFGSPFVCSVHKIARPRCTNGDEWLMYWVVNNPLFWAIFSYTSICFYIAFYLPF